MSIAGALTRLSVLRIVTLTARNSRLPMARLAGALAAAAFAQTSESPPKEKDKQAGGKGKPALTAAEKSQAIKDANAKIARPEYYTPGSTTCPRSMKAWVGDDPRGYSAADIRTRTGRPANVPGNAGAGARKVGPETRP